MSGTEALQPCGIDAGVLLSMRTLHITISAFWSVLVGTVENGMKIVGWMKIDQNKAK